MIWVVIVILHFGVTIYVHQYQFYLPRALFVGNCFSQLKLSSSSSSSDEWLDANSISPCSMPDISESESESRSRCLCRWWCRCNSPVSGSITWVKHHNMSKIVGTLNIYKLTFSFIWERVFIIREWEVRDLGAGDCGILFRLKKGCWVFLQSSIHKFSKGCYFVCKTIEIHGSFIFNGRFFFVDRGVKVFSAYFKGC